MVFNYLSAPDKRHGEPDHVNFKMYNDITRPMLFASTVNERYTGLLNQDVDTSNFADLLAQHVADQDSAMNVEEDQDPLMDLNMTHPSRRNPGIEVMGDMTIPDMQILGGDIDHGYSENLIGGVDYQKFGVVPEEEED